MIYKKNENTRSIVLDAGVCFLVVVAAAAISLDFFIDKKQRTKTERINRQVESYEQTLPGYLEQKQKVIHYRDSLMNVKTR